VNYLSDGVRQGISSFGNPAVWWFGMAATVYAVKAVWKKRDYVPVFLLVAYAAQYLPWVFVSRTTFIYHYFPSVPFVVLIIVYFFKEARVKRLGLFAYGAITAALFLLFYPALSGIPVSVDFVYAYLRWLPGWVLM
jgi:dolichyl-phosphate-mannose--protein O-mannosyl transferase